jgi:hypothetical protein
MNVKYILSLLFSAVLFYCSSCKKESKPAETGTTTSVPLVFTELKAQSTGLHVGEITTITAVASGANLTYSWSCTAGTLVGQGAEVTYGSSCNSCVGLNTITCAVSDGTSSQAKNIEISIK